MSDMNLDRTPHVKAQWIRLLDVVFIGPLMTYGGWRLYQNQERASGMILALLGVGTVFYNGRNYLRVRQAFAAEAATSRPQGAPGLLPDDSPITALPAGSSPEDALFAAGMQETREVPFGA